jgi:hypothetical protein
MCKTKFLYFLYTGLIFIAFGCAKVVSPTGGIKDIAPPEIKTSKPENFSTNFKSKDVTIAFDEYIQLKDLNKSLIISPPMEEKPMIRVKGKSLIIRFESELKDSTTYNIYFGNALQDFNEGNPFTNFQYVFSTGSYIDSMAITGTVLNAFDLTPVEDAFVMLYSDLSDSVPYKEIPVYISKTDKNGAYRINNIRNEKFKIFAIKDANNNYRFDVDSEPIAFIDSLIAFTLETITKSDTIFKSEEIGHTHNPEANDEDLHNHALSREIDTIIEKTTTEYTVKNYTLLLFTEDYEAQYLFNNKRDNEYRLDFIFKRPLKDSLIISWIDNPKTNFILEESEKKDTFIYWLTDTLDYNKTNIPVTLTYQVLDSAKNYFWKTDSLKMKYIETEKKDSDKYLKVNINVKDKATFDLNRDILLQFGTPLFSLDTANMVLFSIEDSVEAKIQYTLLKNKLREYSLLVNWKENTNYRLEIPPAVFSDIYGNKNDTIITEFRTQKLDFYGKLFINIKGIENKNNIIVQLITTDKKTETVVAEKFINKDQIVEFSYLPPKEFLVKLIFDDNDNKVWDTGNYLEHIQPEEVLYYEKSAKIRSNWDVEIGIDLKKRN